MPAVDTETPTSALHPAGPAASTVPEHASSSLETPAATEKPYLVGYGRPPEHGKIKKGEVRNPDGRPKGSKNTATIAREELDRKIPVKVKGRTAKMSRREIAIRKQTEAAVNGNGKAFELVLRLEGAHTGISASSIVAESQNVPLAVRDQTILDFMRSRMLEQARGSKANGNVE